MAMVERVKGIRIPTGLEAHVRAFAEHEGARLVAYAPVHAQRAYFVMDRRHGATDDRGERLHFASLINGTLRIEPVPEIPDHPCLMDDLIALVKRGDDPRERAAD